MPYEEQTMRPRIICLCGSTRFIEAFDAHMLRLTLAGYIVLTVGSHRPISRQYANGLDGRKAALDELHKRKIDLADEVFVINIGGYIGTSTRSEIAYAQQQHKPVIYLEPLC